MRPRIQAALFAIVMAACALDYDALAQSHSGDVACNSGPCLSHSSDENAIGMGGTATANGGTMTGVGGSAQGGSGGNAAGGMGTGGTASNLNEGSTYSTQTRAYALAAMSVSAAPAVAGDCLVHKPGRGNSLIYASTGRTEFDAECVDFARCMETARFYAALGDAHSAVAQAKSCRDANVDVEYRPPVIDDPIDTSQFVTKEELNRAFEASQGK